MKLKLNTASKTSSPTAASPPPIPTPSSTGGFRLKIKTSAPPTPASEFPPVAPLAPPPAPKIKRAPKPSKRAAEASAADDPLSPPTKRPSVSGDSPAKRRISIKLGGLSGLDTSFSSGSALVTPSTATASATPRLKLASSTRRQSTGPKAITLTAKKRPPPRPVGVGYDSEASDAEADPAVEQQFILRFPPDTAQAREDAAYLHSAIEERRMGLSLAEGGADASIRFVTRDMRRALVSVRGRKYAAALVDLPCVVESMKSWDRKGGWWKVADVAQMLLVLGQVHDGPVGQGADEQVKNFRLPKEVDKDMRYAHGLTPPMHWVRKRRFRKRVSYKEVENVDEEVQRLLREDRECAAKGGEVKYKIYDGTAGMDDGASVMDIDGGYLETTEGGTTVQTPMEMDEDADEDEIDEADLLAGLANMEEDDDQQEQTQSSTLQRGVIPAASGHTLVDPMRSSSIAGGLETSSNAGAETPAALHDDHSSPEQGGTRAASADDDDDDDDDEDDDEDDEDASMDAIDEDAQQAAAELTEKREEIADLEREVANRRAEVERTTNNLLKMRARQKLKALEDELAMKRKAFDMEEDDEDD